MGTGNQGYFRKFVLATFGVDDADFAFAQFSQNTNDHKSGFTNGNESGVEHGYLDGYANEHGESYIKMHMPKCCAGNYTIGHREGYKIGYNAGYLRGQNDRAQDRLE